MKIVRKPIPEMTIEKFADKHGLVMGVIERVDPNHPRFYAEFLNSAVKDGPFLIGAYGDGNTEEEAIADYAKNISLKLLSVDAFNAALRKIIRVPRLIVSKKALEQKLKRKEKCRGKRHKREAD